MAEGYGFINGGLTDNLSARLIVNRSRDGVIKDLGAGEDLDSYEDENYTLALDGKMITIPLISEEMKEVMGESSVLPKVQDYSQLVNTAAIQKKRSWYMDIDQLILMFNVLA